MKLAEFGIVIRDEDVERSNGCVSSGLSAWRSGEVRDEHALVDERTLPLLHGDRDDPAPRVGRTALARTDATRRANARCTGHCGDSPSDPALAGQFIVDTREQVACDP
jgi:hypothetical protein